MGFPIVFISFSMNFKYAHLRLSSAWRSSVRPIMSLHVAVDMWTESSRSITKVHPGRRWIVEHDGTPPTLVSD